MAMREHPVARSALAALIGLGMVGSTGGPTAASPAAGEDLMAVQMRLISAAERLQPSLAGTTGLAGVTVETEAGELRVHWSGELPESVRRAIDEERQATPITVLQALHSAEELVAAGMRILAQDGVTGVAPRPDGSALLVSVDGDEEYGRSLPAVRSATVPVVIEPYEQPILAAGRQQDTSPYAGGSIYHFPLPDDLTGVCTTGFAVRVGAANKILSAGHCGDDGDTVFEGNGSGPASVLGTVTGSDLSHDTLLINADATGAVYSGPHTSTTSKPVHMVINNYPHTLVCTSGAVTGQHCQIRIVAVNQAIKVKGENGFYPIFGLVRAEHVTKAPAAGVGDSGGPVVAQDAIPADFLLVYPLGTITAVDPGSQATCGPTQLPSLCSWRVYYADINTALTRYSATIVT